MRYTTFKAFQFVVAFDFFYDSYVNVRLSGQGLLFSERSEWEGIGPYGDPCCNEQVNALSLFCLLLVVLTTELAHRDRESRCCCFETAMPLAPLNSTVYNSSSQKHWGGKNVQLEVRGLCLKEAQGQYPDT